ncbi:hypothetical protein [Floricoccus penangensis]|uniref:hypothetical protein n=1 Tax=Floricoccus penangensis TaxID=1859475 RepID=UPI00203D1D36|nr:hypothetical protein [Floricoccus penangensis]URZ87662.1 hypothetical protein KIW23_01015 [Floricoccus penangensis]
MKELEFEEDEYVILSQDKMFPDSILPLKTDEAILTNMNFIYIYKNLFGSIEDIKYIPLKDIQIRKKEACVSFCKKHGMLYMQLSLIKSNFLFGIDYTGDMFEWKYAIKNVALASSEDKRVTRCDSCGAINSGYEDQIITCKFCQNQIKI